MKADKDQIKELVSMRDIMGLYGLQPQRNKKYLCPFHNEKTPSLSIKEPIFNCFACETKGDIFNFVMQMNNCDFISAKDYICQAFNIPNDYETTPEERKAYAKDIAGRHRIAQERRKRIEKGKHIYSRLCDYRRYLSDNLAIQDFGNELFCEALRNLDYVDYILDKYLDDREGKISVDIPDVVGFIKNLRSV